MPALKHECEGAPPAPEWAGAIPTRFQRLWILGLADAGRRVRAMWTDRQRPHSIACGRADRSGLPFGS
jgi:hypothetical protein